MYVRNVIVYHINDTLPWVAYASVKTLKLSIFSRSLIRNNHNHCDDCFLVVS